jgi:maltose alpha-D-glucosyltransferase / alpha-amylase
MQWNNLSNAGFSGARADRLYAPVIDDDVYGYQRINVAAQQTDQASLFNWLRHALRVRRQHPAFGRGSFEWLPIASPAVVAYWRTLADDHILAIHNLSDQAQPVELDRQPQAWIDLLSDSRITLTSLEPSQYLWLRPAA